MNKIVKDLLKTSKNGYGFVLSDDENPYRAVEFVSTDCPMLNAILYDGDIKKGLPLGRRVMISGESSSGKSYFINFLIKSFLTKMKNSICVLFETEGSSVYEMAKSHGIDPNQVMVLPVSSIEDFKTQCVNLLEKIEQCKNPNSEHYNKEYAESNFIFVLDSLGMLDSNKALEDAQEGHHVADFTRAKQIRSVFRLITLKLSLTKIPMLTVNHTYDAIGKTYVQKMTGGGLGPRFSADISLMCNKSKEVDKDKKQVGVCIRIKVDKSRYMKEGIDVEFPISFQKGLYRYAGILEKAVDCGMITCKAAGSKGKVLTLQDRTEVTEKEFRKNIQTYLTDEFLEQLRDHVKQEFSFGEQKVGVSEESNEDVIDDEQDEEVKEDNVKQESKRRGRPKKA
jgi:RecA/RadA recombinase